MEKRRDDLRLCRSGGKKRTAGQAFRHPNHHGSLFCEWNAIRVPGRCHGRCCRNFPRGRLQTSRRCSSPTASSLLGRVLDGKVGSSNVNSATGVSTEPCAAESMEVLDLFRPVHCGRHWDHLTHATLTRAFAVRARPTLSVGLGDLVCQSLISDAVHACFNIKP